MTESSVELDRVWKRYLLGQGRGVLDALRPRQRQQLWSLQDVSLSMQPGESVGLVGHNGAGKTTTLKILAGITRPTRGRAATHGRVASLINLGAGFHRELTGRENVYLNGVILGLSRQEVRDRFDQIVDYAELGAFIDTPVKQYSTGMYARLGFAVAAHVDPDILLVDEVLSVGDVSFQDKSIRSMLSFRDRGCSILFVSHNLSAIEMMCQRAIWLDHGQVRLHGPATDVVRAYLDSVDDQLVAATGEDDPGGDEATLALEEATLLDTQGRPATDFAWGDPLVARLRCHARAPVDGVRCTVTVRGDYGALFSAADDSSPWLAHWDRGRHTLECRFESLPLLPGLYRLEAELRHAGTDGPVHRRTLAAFRVTTELEAFGSDSLVGRTKSRGGFLAVPYTWHLNAADGPHTLPGLHLPDQSHPSSHPALLAGENPGG